MFELMKIVGVSAVLSAGLVTASEMSSPPAAAPVSGKIYNDRVPQGGPTLIRALIMQPVGETRQASQAIQTAGIKGDMQRNAPQGCETQAWPNLAPQCLQAAAGTPSRSSVRMITVEHREGENTSVLMRVSTSDYAQR